MYSWRELYLRAIFEDDHSRLRSRIHEAEQALNLRRRQLFTVSGNKLEERDAIDNALHQLRALSYCARVESKTNAVA